ncbi:hypothetical protein N9R54_06235, partial [Pelobium sp.]
MKNYNRYFKIFIGLVLTLSACKKDDLSVVDVPFSADKVTINAGETVNFTIGSGANASAIYTGDLGSDFTRSRINMVEFKGLTEQQLRDSAYAERITGLKEYELFAPKLNSLPNGYSYTGGTIDLYDGKLVPWDYSNATNSRYLKMNLTNGPQTLAINAQKAVVPGMLNYAKTQLQNLNAITTVPNNNLSMFMSFPDGFKPTDINGLNVRFGFQIVINGLASDIIYQTLNVREVVYNYINVDLLAGGGLIAKWKAK